MATFTRACVRCGRPIPRGSRCERHALQSKAARYNWPHRRLRAQLAPAVAAGGVRCARCNELIGPGEPWDLDHADRGGGYLGASHARCNRATAAR